jgi:glutamate N-acetyltransferase/amino-acid N-acetyltransferase
MAKSPALRLIPGGLPLWGVLGFKCGAAYAGLKLPKPGVLDIGVLWAPGGATAAGVFTRNQACAAPVTWSRRVAARGRASAAVMNSGNANACTGPQGERDAAEMAAIAARALGTCAAEVFVASTGVIGKPLDMAKVRAGLWEAAIEATGAGKARFERAIMTTDLVQKRAACRARIGGRTITVAGVTKGSGMIAPNVATMLAYIVTDATVEPKVLRTALQWCADRSFNCLTVDGQGSTNDSVFLMASGLSGPKIARAAGAAYAKFLSALEAVCRDLARQIARDGEGATKLVNVNIAGAKSDADARIAARAVAESMLVKCALFGCDPNWGRILSAIGMSRAKLDTTKARVEVSGVKVYDRKPLKFDPKKAKKALSVKELDLNVDLRLGKGSATFYTCDLTYGYVKINAEYHT